MLLSVRDLVVSFPSSHGEAVILKGISFDVAEGEIVGVVGESGAGKSTMAWSVMNLVRPPGRIDRGRVMFQEVNLLGLRIDQLRKIRGNHISLVPSNPRACLDPLVRVGDQIAAVYRTHRGVSKTEAAQRTREMLRDVGLTDAERIAGSYPHELSGGMAQRAIIALAWICGPALVIADEPTSGLDVTVQAQVLDLLHELVRNHGASALLITHDLGVVAHYCDRVIVMLNGEIVESATTHDLFNRPQHPYAQKLVRSVVRVATERVNSEV